MQGVPSFDPRRFEEAVLLQLQQNCNKDDRLKAENFIDSFTEHPESGWRFILGAFPNFENGRVRFALLNSLNKWIHGRWGSVPAQGRRQICQMLMNWGVRYLPQDVEDVNVVRGKYAQTLTLLFVHEFPHSWPTFFDELLGLLPKHVCHVDMFLRVLDTIDELVVSTEFPRTQEEVVRNGHLKDAMRTGAIPGIVKAWYSIMGNQGQNSPQMVSKTLHVMKKYAPWIDIQYFANPQFMSMMASFLTKEAYQKEAAKLVASVTNKGMPPIDKLELIRRFQLLQMCGASRPAKDTRFAVHIARWINAIGMHILDGITTLREGGAPAAAIAKALEMQDACVSLTLSCLKQLHAEAAIEVVDFAARYVSSLKAGGASNLRPPDIAALNDMLQSMSRLLMYAQDFEFPSGVDEGEDDDLLEWLEQRDRLAHLFRTVGRLNPGLTSDMVKSLAENVFPRHANVPWNNVEVVLYMILCLGDVLVQEGASEMRTRFQPFLILLMQTDVAGNPSFVVTKSCFEVLVRFFRYVPSDEKILNMIVHMTENRGIRHGHPAVRRRAMFTFQRLSQKYGHLMVPALPRLLQSMHGLLLPLSSRPQDDHFLFQVTLYESLGLLIGQNADDVTQPQQVDVVMGPVVAELRKLVHSPDPQMSHMRLCLMASRTLEVIIAFSRGFNGIVNRKNRTKDMFVDVLQLVLHLRRKRLGDEDLQSKCIQVMHRMVELLQQEFLGNLEQIVQMLLIEGGTSGAQDFMKLMGQLINRFGARIHGFLNAILAPLTRKVFEYVASGEAELSKQASVVGDAVALSELGREVRELRTSYYGFLHALCKNADLAQVLFVPENSGLLEAVLKALKQGTLWWGYPREQRDVWATISILLEGFGGHKNAGIFRTWFAREMIPILLQSPCSDVFPIEMGAYVVCMRTMCAVQHVALMVMKEEFINLLGSFLNSVGCDDATKSQYLNLLQGQDKDAFVAFFENLAKRVRKQRKGGKHG